jgi:major membrane immunogen (membrane-anchored lipoprotein)
MSLVVRSVRRGIVGALLSMSLLTACSSDSEGGTTSSSGTTATIPTAQATCDKILAVCNTADAGATYTCDAKAFDARKDADEVKLCVQKAERRCEAVEECTTVE